MKIFPFKKMDAFTKGKASGNPAGCVYLTEDTIISDAQMQQIAKELKGFVNEVGFLRSDQESLELKYFSSECEVEFCGHATIAIMYDLISENEEFRGKPELYVNVGTNRLAVLNKIAEEDSVYIMAPPPQFLHCQLNAAEIASALSADESVIDAGLPIRIINAGLRTLIVPLVSLVACLCLRPDQEKLRLFCEDSKIDIILVFSQETLLPMCRYRTRVFAPKYGYLEDPATGSGNSALGHYLLELGQWKDGSVILEQGPSREIPNIVKLRFTMDSQGERVLFGGASVLRINGSYCLNE